MYPIYFKYFMILEFLIQTLESGICCLQRTCSNFSLVDGGFVKCVRCEEAGCVCILGLKRASTEDLDLKTAKLFLKREDRASNSRI